MAVPTLINQKTMTIVTIKVSKKPMTKREMVKSLYPKKVRKRPKATPIKANTILFF